MSTLSPLKVGYHVSKSSGLVKNIKTLLSEGGSAVQCFLSPNKGFHPGIPLKDAEVQEILNLKSELGLFIVVHGKYILNFARPHDTQKSWQRDALLSDLIQADRLDADVIIHQGKNVKDLNCSKAQSIETFVLNLTAIIDQMWSLKLQNKILLENSCQQGTEFGYTIGELAEIYQKFPKKYQEQLGFCLDLCHIHVSGTMNVASAQDVTKVLEQFNELIGMDKLQVIHFNDSKIRFDGHNDSHEDILMGYIGNSSLTDPKGHIGSSEGFKEIINIAQTNNIPLILETPAKVVPYRDQIKLLLKWGEQDTSYESEYIQKYRPTPKKKILIKKKLTYKPFNT